MALPYRLLYRTHLVYPPPASSLYSKQVVGNTAAVSTRVEQPLEPLLFRSSHLCPLVGEPCPMPLCDKSVLIGHARVLTQRAQYSTSYFSVT